MVAGITKQPRTEDWTFKPDLTPLGRRREGVGEACRLNQSPMANYLINHTSVMRALQKLKRAALGELPGRLTHGAMGRTVNPERE